MTFGIDLPKKTTNQQQKRENITKSQAQNDNTELDGQQEEAGDFPEHLGTHQTWAVFNCAMDCVLMKKPTGLVSIQCFCIPRPRHYSAAMTACRGSSKSISVNYMGIGPVFQECQQCFPFWAWKPNKDKLQLISAALGIM